MNFMVFLISVACLLSQTLDAQTDGFPGVEYFDSGRIAASVHWLEDERREIVTNADIYHRIKRVDEGGFFDSVLHDRTLSDAQKQARIKNYIKDVLEEIIDRKIAISEAKQRNIKVKEEDIDFRLKRTIDMYGSDYFERHGLSTQTIRDEIRESIRVFWLYYHHARFDGQLAVSEDEKRSYYEAYAARYHQPERVTIHEFVIPFGEKGKDKNTTRRFARHLDRKLKNGASILDLCYRYKNHGVGIYYKLVKAGQQHSHFQSRTFAIKPGTIEGPVERDDGIYFYEVVRKQQSFTNTYSDVQKEINGKLILDRLDAARPAIKVKLRKKVLIFYGEFFKDD